MTIQFSDELDCAARAADRFERLLPRRSFGAYDRRAFIMDMLAADGANGNAPLRWDDLLAADDEQFAHDAAGIWNHMNRQTGQLEGGFVPRYAHQ